MALPEKVAKNQIAPERRDEMFESMAEQVRGYIAGDHFEDRLHKLVCDFMGISTTYDPNAIDEDDVGETALQEAYYHLYAAFQGKVLAMASIGL